MALTPEQEREKEILELQIAIAEAEQEKTAEPAREVEDPGIARKTANAVFGGLADAGEAIVDLPHTVRSGIDWAAGKAGLDTTTDNPWISAPKISELPVFKQTFDAMQDWGITENNSPVSDAVRTGVDWAAGAIVPGSKAQKYGDLAMGAGAGIADYIFENDYAELGGGAAGYIANLLRGRIKPPPKKRGLTKPEERAVEFIEGNVETPIDADELQRVIDSEQVGTTADLLDDRGLYDVQRGASQDPKIARQVDDVEIARQRQIAADVRGELGDTASDTVQPSAQARVAEREKLAQDAGKSRVANLEADAARTSDELLEQSQASTQGVQQADEVSVLAQARQAADEIPFEDAPRPAQASRNLSEAYDVDEAAFKKSIEDPAWDKYRAQPEVEVKPLWDAANEYIKGLDKGLRDELGKKYGSLINRMNKFVKTGVGTPAEVADVLRRIKEKLASVEPQNWTIDETNLKGVAKAMESALEESNPFYKDARTQTRIKNERFRPGKIDKLRNAREPETFAARANLQNESGAARIREMRQAQTTGIDDAILLQMEAYAKDQGIDENFLRNFGDVLDTMLPADRNKFIDLYESSQAAKVAEDAASSAGKADAGLQKTLEQQQQNVSSKLGTDTAQVGQDVASLEKATGKNVVGRFAENPQSTLSTLLSSTDNIPDLKRLYKAMADRGEGDAFRGLVRDMFEEQAFKGADTTTSVLPKARGQFDNMQQQLIDAGILTENQAKTIQQSLKRTSSQTSKSKANAVMKERFDAGWKNVASALGASQVLNVMGAGTQLMVGGGLRRMFNKLLTAKGEIPDLEALNKFLLDPQAMADALKGVQTADEAVRRIATAVVGATNTAALLDEEE